MTTFLTPDMLLKGIGESIKQARLRKEIPAEEVADRAGISRATLGKAEKGDGGVSMETYVNLLFCLGLEQNLFRLISADASNQQSLGFDSEEQKKQLSQWVAESLERWEECLDRNEVSADDPKRFPHGYWYVAFMMNSMNIPSLSELMSAIETNMVKYSSIPPFSDEKCRPYPVGNNIEAWSGANNRAERSDFWRISKSGYGFLLRPFQEDGPRYNADGTNADRIGKSFDWELPVYRMAEIFNFMGMLSARFSEGKGRFRFMLHYEKTLNRELTQHTLEYMLPTGVCMANELKSEISGSMQQVRDDLSNVIHHLLVPVYEQFDFIELHKDFVDAVLKRMQKNRRITLHSRA